MDVLLLRSVRAVAAGLIPGRQPFWSHGVGTIARPHEWAILNGGWWYPAAAGVVTGAGRACTAGPTG